MLSPKLYKLAITPHMPLAACIFFATIILFSETWKNKKIGPIILSTFLLGNIMMFESILGIYFLGALFVGSCIIFIRFKRPEYLTSACVGGMFAFGLAIFARGRLGGGHGLLTLNFPFFLQAIRNLPQPLKEPFRIVLATYHQGFQKTNMNLLLNAAIIPFLLVYAVIKDTFVQFQFGLIGFKEVYKKAKYIMNDTIENIYFLVALILGITLPLFISISFSWIASFRIFFFAKALLYGFAAPVVIKAWQGGKIKKMALMLFVIVFLILPTAQNLKNRWKYSNYYSLRTGNEMQIYHFLRTQTPKDAILMHPFVDDPISDPAKNGAVVWVLEDHFYYGSALGGRQVVLEGSIEGPAVQMARFTLEEIKKVRSDIETVYTTTNPSRARELLSHYKISYLWVPKSKKLNFDPSSFLKTAIENQDHILYQVVGK